MIIYGWRSVCTRTEHLQHEKCSFCEPEGTMNMHIFSSYAHIFWIPVFPYRKYGVAHCGSCGRTFEKRDMTESLKREYERVKSYVRHPIWSFAGLAAIGVLIVIVSISAKADKDTDLTYIQSPLAGDMYSVKTEGGYTLMQVIAVEDSIIEAVTMDYMSTKLSGLSKLQREYGFTDTIGLYKSGVKKMYDEGLIVDVDR